MNRVPIVNPHRLTAVARILGETESGLEPGVALVSDMKAWLITWEWVGDHAAVANPIACVLPPQWSIERVARAVQLLYAVNVYTVTELAAFAKRPSKNPYKAEYSGYRITCGHNPHLAARVVSELKIDVDPNGQLETIRWKDPDRYRFKGGKRIMIARGVDRSLQRRKSTVAPTCLGATR